MDATRGAQESGRRRRDPAAEQDRAGLQVPHDCRRITSNRSRALAAVAGEERGMTLIEVVVALALLLMVLTPAVYLIESIFAGAAVNKSHVEGASLASSQVACIKAHPTGVFLPSFSSGAQLQSSDSGTTHPTSYSSAGDGWPACQGNGNTAGTQVAAGTPYSFSQSVEVVEDAGGSISPSTGAVAGATLTSKCFGLGGDPQLLLRAVSTVTWGSGTRKASVSQATLETPPQIDVLVQNPNGVGVPNITVSVGGTPPDAATNPSGCAAFVGLAPGSYTVTADPSGASQVSEAVNLGLSQILTVVFPSKITDPCELDPSQCGNPGGPPVIEAIAAPPWDQPSTASMSAFGPVDGGNTVVLCVLNPPGTTGIYQASFDPASDSNGSEASTAAVQQASPSDSSYCSGLNGSWQAVDVTAPASPDPSGGDAHVTLSNPAGTSNAATYNYDVNPYIYRIYSCQGGQTAAQCTYQDSGDPNAQCAPGNPPPGSPTRCRYEVPSGTPWGNTQLEIVGFNFSGATNVEVCVYITNGQACGSSGSNGLPAGIDASFNVDSDTEITAKTPVDWYLCDPLANFGFCAGWDLLLGNSVNWASITVTGQHSYTLNGNTQTETVSSDPLDTGTSTSNCQDEATYDRSINGGSDLSLNGQNVACNYLYIFPPSVSSISPAAGPIGGGTTVTICGGGFNPTGGNALSNPGGTYEVGFDYPADSGATYYPAASFSVQKFSWSILDPLNLGPCPSDLANLGHDLTNGLSYNYITAASPPSPPSPPDAAGVDGGSACVQVVDNALSASSCNPPTTTFTWDHLPHISSCKSPAAGYCGGPVGGGNPVTLYGNYFDHVTTVNFGCDAVTVQAGWTTSTGNGLGETLTIPNAPAAHYHSLLLGCTSTLNGPEQVPLYLANPVGTSNSVTYTYANTPHISDISPTNGPAGGGNTVTICGSNFDYIQEVAFWDGGTGWASSISGYSTAVWVWPFKGPCGEGGVGGSEEYFTVHAPPSPNGNYDQVHVQATNWADEGSNAYWAYTYLSPPSISSVSPTNYSHCTAGGVGWFGVKYWGWCTLNLTFNIYGSNFNDVSASIGGQSASITWHNSSWITASVSYTGYGWDARICLPNSTVTVSNPAGSSSWGSLSCN